jgi:hypothetical protein
MWRSLFRDRKLVILFLLAVLMRIFSLDPDRVEQWYTTGFYPWFSRFLRLLFGWIPFSVGDLLYVFAFCYLVWKAFKLIRILARRQVKEYLSWILFRKYLRLVLWIYLVFNIFWGLNYNRQGVAHQLGLSVSRYTLPDLEAITTVLQERSNDCAIRVDTVGRLRFENNRTLFSQGIRDYQQAKQVYPFLTYSRPSIKASLFSPVGHYFGFSGYFNPFTGEAQLNTSEPVFVKPFVLNHEIGHQLGYGKENEASFASFLACHTSTDVEVRYSVYYEMYFNALSECRANGDTAFVRRMRKSLHPRVLRDKLAELQFRLRRKNGLQPYVSDFYDNYLRMNNQPNGLSTYNEVIAWLIAYMKKYGTRAI